MRLTSAQRTQKMMEIRKKYDAYMEARQNLEDVIKARVEQEVARETGDLTLEFSKVLHDYAREGVPKKVLREATRKYSNNEAFLKLWEPADEGDVQFFPGRPGRGVPYVVEDGRTWLTRGPEGEGRVPVRVGGDGLLQVPSILWEEDYVEELAALFGAGARVAEISEWLEKELARDGELMEDFISDVKEREGN